MDIKLGGGHYINIILSASAVWRYGTAPDPASRRKIRYRLFYFSFSRVIRAHRPRFCQRRLARPMWEKATLNAGLRRPLWRTPWRRYNAGGSVLPCFLGLALRWGRRWGGGGHGLVPEGSQTPLKPLLSNYNGSALRLSSFAAGILAKVGRNCVPFALGTIGHTLPTGSLNIT
jgi:hypothetical protein